MSAAEPRTLMRSIISSSLRFRYLVVAAAAAMMVIGIVAIPSMHVDVFPEFAPPRVLVQTACVGLSTSDVEQLVTVRLGSVAQVSLQPNPNSIDRQGDSRYLDVGANVAGRDLGSVVGEINKKLASVHLDRGAR